MRSFAGSALVLSGLVTAVFAAPSRLVIKVREWRATHERQILAELMQFVSLPSISSNQADIVKNADALAAMFEKRGFGVRRIATPGSPVVIAPPLGGDRHLHGTDYDEQVIGACC